MAVGEARDLWEVGHDDDLARDREAGQAATDREPGLAPDPRVHLVEDERGDIIEVRQDAPTREHHAGELSPAGGFAEREPWLSGATPEPELHPFGAGRAGFRERFQAHLDARTGHPEVLELALERVRERGCGSRSTGGDPFRQGGHPRSERLHLAPQLPETLGGTAAG